MTLTREEVLLAAETAKRYPPNRAFDWGTTAELEFPTGVVYAINNDRTVLQHC